MLTAEELSRALELRKPHIAEVHKVVNEVAAHTGVHPLNIIGHSRKPEFVRARDLVCWIAHERLKLNYTKIGEALSGRDHTTIITAVRREEARR